MKALKAQGISRDSLPYKAPFQPWGNWFAFVSTVVITFFKGFDTFLPWNTANFITLVLSLLLKYIILLILFSLCNRNYIAIPVFFALWIGYKVMYKSKQLKPTEVDLVTGLRRIDEEEKKFLAEEAAKGPRTRWQKIWDSL